MMTRTERHLSRSIIVVGADGSIRKHTLAIATITIENGVVADVSLTPFEREEAGVTYHDHPLVIHIGQPWP